MKILSFLRLLEAKDPEGKDWDIVVIEAGLGKNNRFYPAEVLKKARHLYQHIPVNLFKLGDFDHVPDELEEIKSHLVGNQVGFLEDPRFSEFKVDGLSKKGILARLHIDEGAKSLRAKLLDWWKHGVIDRLGLSHDAGGDTTKDHLSGIETVDKIKEISSVELVTYPAQGGQFLRLLASQGGKTMLKELGKALLSIFKKIDADLVEGIDEEDISEDQFLEMLEAGLEKEEFFTEAKELEAKQPFMQATINRVVKLLKGDKKDKALKLLTDLLPKLKKYGFPKVSGYYGYPAPKAKASAPPDNEPTFEDLFPEGVDESVYTDCMKREMKAGKSMKDAAPICKLEAKKKESDDGNGKGDEVALTVEDLFPEGVDESAYTDCMKREMKAGKSMKVAAGICKVEAKKKKESDADGDGDEDPNKAALEAANKAALEAADKAAVDRIAKIEEGLKTSESAATLEELLGQSDLFEPVKEKIRVQFKDRIFEKKDLQESIKIEKDVLAKLSESGNLKGLGESKADVTLDESDKKQIAMDLMFGVEVKDKKGVGPFRSIKEAYRSMNPKDHDITFQNQRPRRISEATMVVADFDNALGTSITRKMLKIYKLLPLPWREFCNVVPVDNFKLQERIRWGGFGEFPTIHDTGHEDDLYEDIAFPTDEKATYTPLTKGGLVSISRKTIKNDDMHMLRQIPVRLARAAAKTLNSFIWDFLKNGDNIYDGAALFTAARGNLGTAALDFDSLNVAVTALKSMREKGNYELEGTATGSSASTLETGKTWTVDLYKNHYVRIVLGTGVGQFRLIASHTTEGVITVSPDWAETPATDCKYEIFQYPDEKIGIKPGYLAVPTELEATARKILTNDWEPDTVERNINTLKNVAKLMEVSSLTDANDWYLIADKTWLDLFEIGFIDGKEEPEILIQDQPNVGTMFTRDRMTYKVRHEYGGAPVDFRGFYKAVVG